MIEKQTFNFLLLVFISFFLAHFLSLCILDSLMLSYVILSYVSECIFQCKTLVIILSHYLAPPPAAVATPQTLAISRAVK